MRRTLAAAAVATMLAAPTAVVATASPALADTENCVSSAEWDSLHNGLNPTQVEAVFDVYGTYDGEDETGYKRRYNLCNSFSDGVGVVWYSWNTGDTYNSRWRIR